MVGIREQISRCPDCHALPDTLHLSGCDVERCPACGHQFISCGCGKFSDIRRRARLRWTGTWPGVEDCQRLGWCCKPTKDGYVPCDKTDPEATEDLNRLAAHGVWHVAVGRFEAT